MTASNGASNYLDALTEVIKQQAALMETLVSVVAAPKMVIRDSDGFIVGTKSVLE